MMTYIIAVFRKIFFALEASGRARARRVMTKYDKGAWQ